MDTGGGVGGWGGDYFAYTVIVLFSLFSYSNEPLCPKWVQTDLFRHGGDIMF